MRIPSVPSAKREGAATGRFAPFAKPSANGRYLRIGDDGIGGETVVLGVGAMTALSAALIGVQYPHKESQFLTEGSR
jgi:hypothetical protein